MMNEYDIAWIDPADLAGSLDDEIFVLLHSSQQADYSGRYSLLARSPLETVQADTFAPLASRLGTHAMTFENAWFGYLAYGLKHDVERLPPDAPGNYPHTPLWMTRFAEIYRFDHLERKLTCYSAEPPARVAPREAGALPAVQTLHSNLTKAEYLKAAARVINAVHEGELYQANLTRKFFGRFTHAPDVHALYAALRKASPAAYGALLRTPDFALISSSPERFLHIRPDGYITTRPIKGSARRDADAKSDAQIASALHASPKDRAENLMIVDLMRNDLARACTPGSVRVEKLFELNTHATVHHLTSTVSGKLAAGISALDAVRHCFPPGSMTGAPKIRAIELCSELEPTERGIYSGAVGWFGGDGSTDLSVVIRTLIIQGDYFEFQVGGGIVADSTPEGEWRETLVKATGIARALAIPLETLEAL